jgi:virginiamycin B lyase
VNKKVCNVKKIGFFWVVFGSFLSFFAWGGESAFKTFKIPTANAFVGKLDVDKATDAIWFVESNSNKIGKFHLDQELFSEYDIPTYRSVPVDIVVSKQGKVWFTESDANQIGVFDPVSLSFKEYNIPTIESSPYRIAADNDGNVWFTEFYGNKVGMFDPKQEVFREYVVPTPSSRPTGIAIDRKGVVWFMETQGNKLGRLDPKDGTIREFELPTKHESSVDFTIDESGVLWFGGNKSHTLMSFNPESEKFKTFAVPGGGVIESLVAGSDGKIICSLKNIGKLGIFDPSNQRFSVIKLALGNSKPTDISIDTKGNIWFADPGKNALFWLDGKMLPKLWLK